MVSLKDEMFVIGSAAAARAAMVSKRYVCPLCRRSFFEADKDKLSIEHVPAKALGGKPLVLTCVPCNSEAGHRLQGHQKEKERLADFWAGSGAAPLSVEVETNVGAIIRGTATHFANGEVRIQVDQKRMSPEHIRRVQELDKGLSYDGYRIGRRFDNRKARIADLRDAYLWVFARYGYRAVAVPFFDWVREAIETRVAAHDKWAVDIVNSPPHELFMKVGKPLIFRLLEPSDTLLVCHGSSGVLLPTLFNQGPYSELGEDNASLTIVPNESVCVPEKMHMGFDFNQELDQFFS